MLAAERKNEVAKYVDDGKVTCPYDRTHREEPSRMMHHLITCSGNKKGTYRCPFNAKHHFLSKDEYQAHLNTCNGLYGINKMLYQESCNVKKLKVPKNILASLTSSSSSRLRKHISFSTPTDVTARLQKGHSESALPPKRDHCRRQSYPPAETELTKMLKSKNTIKNNEGNFMKKIDQKYITKNSRLSLSSNKENIFPTNADGAGLNLFSQQVNSSSSPLERIPTSCIFNKENISPVPLDNLAKNSPETSSKDNHLMKLQLEYCPKQQEMTTVIPKRQFLSPVQDLVLNKKSPTTLTDGSLLSKRKLASTTPTIASLLTNEIKFHPYKASLKKKRSCMPLGDISSIINEKNFSSVFMDSKILPKRKSPSSRKVKTVVLSDRKHFSTDLLNTSDISRQQVSSPKYSAISTSPNEINISASSENIFTPPKDQSHSKIQTQEFVKEIEKQALKRENISLTNANDFKIFKCENSPPTQRTTSRSSYLIKNEFNMSPGEENSLAVDVANYIATNQHNFSSSDLVPKSPKEALQEIEGDINLFEFSNNSYVGHMSHNLGHQQGCKLTLHI